MLERAGAPSLRDARDARRTARQDAKTRQMLGLVKAVVPAMVQGVRPAAAATPPMRSALMKCSSVVSTGI